MFLTHSLHKIWIHAVWSTFDNKLLISPFVERRLYDFMKQQFAEYGCPAWIINGMPDHVHCLFMLSSQISVSMLLKQVKGGSAHYVNQAQLCEDRFAWQKGYAAYSVSDEKAPDMYEYINAQKRVHKDIGFLEEFEVLLQSNCSDLGEYGNRKC